MTRTVAEKRAAFRALHQQGCFVLPNPWYAGSARMLQHLGFAALASTSSGFAWSTGRPDYAVTCADVLQHPCTAHIPGIGQHETTLLVKRAKGSAFFGDSTGHQNLIVCGRNSGRYSARIDRGCKRESAQAALGAGNFLIHLPRRYGHGYGKQKC